jgi:hypothetical protein
MIETYWKQQCYPLEVIQTTRGNILIRQEHSYFPTVFFDNLLDIISYKPISTSTKQIVETYILTRFRQYYKDKVIIHNVESFFEDDKLHDCKWLKLAVELSFVDSRPDWYQQQVFLIQIGFL